MRKAFFTIAFIVSALLVSCQKKQVEYSERPTMRFEFNTVSYLERNYGARHSDISTSDIHGTLFLTKDSLIIEYSYPEKNRTASKIVEVCRNEKEKRYEVSTDSLGNFDFDFNEINGEIDNSEIIITGYAPVSLGRYYIAMYSYYDSKERNK